MSSLRSFVIRCMLKAGRLTPGALLAALLAGLVLCPTLRSADPPSTVPLELEKEIGNLKLYKKVVAIRRTKLFPKLEDSPKRGLDIVPFSIFFRIGEKDDLVRVGNQEGKPLGWVKKSDLQDWNTRFILDPIRPRKDCRFTFKAIIRGKEEVIPLLSVGEKGTNRARGFILGKPKEKASGGEVYRIFFSTGSQADQQGLIDIPEEEEIKLEIVFVLESSDFMKKKFPGDDKKALLDYLHELVETTVAELTRDEQKKKAVRLGFVQYWDNVPWREGDKRLEVGGLKQWPSEAKKTAEAQLRELSPKFPAAIGCDLTNDVEEFRRGMKKVTGIQLLDDWADDGLAGLNEAVSKVKWSKNSFKHVILIGSASFQTEPQGTVLSQLHPGKDNVITRDPTDLPRGYSSTRLTIKELIDRAQPTGGGVGIDLSPKYFHALFLPNEQIDLVQISRAQKWPLDEQKITRYRERFAEVILAPTDEIALKLRAKLVEDLATELGARDKALQFYGLLFRARVIDYQANRAREQYQKLIERRNGGSGYFRPVGPSAADVQKAINELSQKLLESFRYIKSLRKGHEGTPLTAPVNNSIALPIWNVSQEIADELKTRSTIEGEAELYDEKGQEIAQKKIFVSQREMKRLHGLLRDWHDRFSALGAEGNRDDANKVLRILQESLAKHGYGQTKDKDKKDSETPLEEKKLEELLDGLPVRSAALKLRAKDIETMPTDKFNKWLNLIKDARDRADRIYNDKSQWSKFNQGAVPNEEEYGFFPLDVMP